MAPKYEHFMDEADIGSGEKTPTEMEDLEQTKHLREQQEQARQQARPMDGALLQQVIEEQQYINQHESHTPHGVVDDGIATEEGKKDEQVQAVPAMPVKPAQKAKKPASPPNNSGR
jgi:DNA-binding protein H-NS